MREADKVCVHDSPVHRERYREDVAGVSYGQSTGGERSGQVAQLTSSRVRGISQDSPQERKDILREDGQDVALREAVVETTCCVVRAHELQMAEFVLTLPL